MKRGPAAVALCLLVVLSGCSAILGPSGTDGEPPGVENGTLEDSEALLDAHAESLTASGYSHLVELNQSQTRNGTTTTVNREQRTSVAAGASTYRSEIVTSGARDSRFVLWGNQTAEYRRIESRGQEQYSTGQPTNATLLTGVNLVRPYLTGPFEVAETTTENGETRVALESTGRPTGDVLPKNAESVSVYNARLVVDPEGRIHRLRVNGEYTVDNRTVSFEVQFEVTSFENADVERPSWVDSAASSG